MSLHYLLDGYNIINQVPLWCEGMLEDRRRKLIAWLNVARPHGSIRNTVTVVFDGKPQHYGGHSSGEAKVVFTAGESADDCIKRMVERCPDKKKFMVISDDKGIKLYVRALGAGVLSVREFAADLFQRRAGPLKARTTKAGPPGENKYISLTQTQKINKEFEGIWLQ